MKQYLNTFDKKETIKATKQVKLYQMMKRSIIKFKNVDIKYLTRYIGFVESDCPNKRWCRRCLAQSHGGICFKR